MKYDNETINITHEFPLQFYLDGFAEEVTSYDYCLVHRYLSEYKYKEYMQNQVKKGRIVYLDNSLYELGSSWDSDEYARVIQELKPTYYMLPDVFDDFIGNIRSQISFYRRYASYFPESFPVIIPHAYTLEEKESLIESIKRLIWGLPLDCRDKIMIALPFGDHSFLNDKCEVGYMNASMYEHCCYYTPHLQALNRGIFLERHYEELKPFKIHLLGCKGLGEFTAISRGYKYNKSNIISIDTSHPVAFTLTDSSQRYDSNEALIITEDTEPFTHKPRKMCIPYLYNKPVYLIDDHFYDKFPDSIYDDLLENINYFQKEVKKWREN